MNKIILAALFFLTACATDRPAEDAEESTSGATVYGQIAVSVDYISLD